MFCKKKKKLKDLPTHKYSAKNPLTSINTLFCAPKDIKGSPDAIFVRREILYRFIFSNADLCVKKGFSDAFSYISRAFVRQKISIFL